MKIGGPSGFGGGLGVSELMAQKASFAHTYGSASPTPYYRHYAPTRLSIVAYPAALVDTISDLRLSTGWVIDLGCGYGTLGALLRTELSLEGIYASYLSEDRPGVAARPDHPTIVGVDQSKRALASARREELIDVGVETDLNAPMFRGSEYGRDALLVCTAVLGYVHPAALWDAIEALNPGIAIITCVTWLAGEFRSSCRGRSRTVVQLNERPLFQRWATESELRSMPGALIEGAHRAECFMVTDRKVDPEPLKERVACLQRSRGADKWLAAGRTGGCELQRISAR